MKKLLLGLLAFAQVAFAQTLPSNTVKFGDGAASNKQIIFNKGGSNPQIRWNNSGSYLEQSADGTNFNKLSPPAQAELTNLSFTATVAASALTIALKDQSGSDPSATSPVRIGFRNSSASTGTFLTRTVTSALSLVVPSSATLGMTSGLSGYLYVYLLDNAGTPELAVSMTEFPEASVLTTTTISASATSPAVAYSTTGRSSVPIREIGRIAVSEATAGTWATGPTEFAIGNKFFNTVYMVAKRITSSQAVANSTSTEIVWNSAVKDPFAMLNTSTGDMTIRVAGTYEFSGHISHSEVAATHTTIASVYQNGSGVYNTYQGKYGSSTDSNGEGFDYIVTCAVGDIMQIRWFQDSASSLNVFGDNVNTGSTNVFVKRIGD